MRTARERRDGGFTLVELLVVIAILGILAGVVVFAVRGIGSKGENEALASDRRTLRTAQEAFCARFGEYGTERQLAGLDPAPDRNNHKFISEESELNDIELLTGAGDPKPCGNTGYRIVPIDGGGSTPDGAADPPGPGSFALTLPPPFVDREVATLVALADGKILAYATGGLDNTAARTRAALYEPAQGVWIPATPPPALAEPTDRYGVLLADDPATAANDCGSRCGQVLVHAYVNWLRFNPVASGTWEEVDGPAYSKGSFVVAGAILLLDDPTTPGLVECGQSCGKVFITSREEPNPYADLYDPIIDSFKRINYPSGLEVTIASSQSLTRLKDGRVLMIAPASPAPRVFIFDPIDESFTEVDSPTNPSFFVEPGMPAGTALPNGDVFFVPNDVFRPAPRGSGELSGTWSKTGECPVEPGERCLFLASAPDGTVLAHVRKEGAITGQTRRYGYRSRTWVPAAPLVKSESVGAHVFLERACGSNCGKILLARTTAELYTP